MSSMITVSLSLYHSICLNDMPTKLSCDCLAMFISVATLFSITYTHTSLVRLCQLYANYLLSPPNQEIPRGDQQML